MNNESKEILKSRLDWRITYTIEPSHIHDGFEVGRCYGTTDIDEYLVRIAGNIMAVGEPHHVPAGMIKGYIVRLEDYLLKGIDDGSMSDLLDSVDDDLVKFYQPLLGEPECGRQARKGKLPIGVARRVGLKRVLIVDKVQVDPIFRGRYLGLVACTDFVRTFGTMGDLVACEPAPIGMQVTDEASKVRRLKAVTSLRRYWACLGFRQVGDSAIVAMFVDPDEPDLPKAVRTLRRAKTKP